MSCTEEHDSPQIDNLIAFTGLKGSGKSTAAELIADHYDYRVVSFADKVREIAAKLFGFDLAKLKDPDYKEEYVEELGKTRREVLQWVGMTMRDTYGADFWIRKMEENIREANNRWPHRNYVIDDVRFPNEAEWVKQQGGVVCGIVDTNIMHEDEMGMIGGHIEAMHEVCDDHSSESEMPENWDSMTDVTVFNEKTSGKARLCDELERSICIEGAHVAKHIADAEFFDQVQGDVEANTGRPEYIYVAGPYTEGNPDGNVRAAVDAADELMEAGYTPFCPHLNFLWGLRHDRPYDDWLDWCLQWVEQCDALLRLDGHSPGGDTEVERAEDRGMPVYHGLDEVPGVVTEEEGHRQLKQALD